MPFTKQMLDEQSKKIAELKEQLSRMNADFEYLTQKTAEIGMNFDDVPDDDPSLQQLLKEAENRAKQVSSTISMQNNTSVPSKPRPGSSRRGVIRL